MKLRFTAFSISSIDMNTVITLRRKTKPATPSANRIALRIRYQDNGTLCGSTGISVDLPSREYDCPEDRNQDQHTDHFKGQQVNFKKPLADFVSSAVLERAELHAFGGREHALNDISHQ